MCIRDSGRGLGWPKCRRNLLRCSSKMRKKHQNNENICSNLCLVCVGRCLYCIYLIQNRWHRQACEHQAVFSHDVIFQCYSHPNGLSPEPVLPVLEQAEFIGTGRNRQNTWEDLQNCQIEQVRARVWGKAWPLHNKIVKYFRPRMINSPRASTSRRYGG